MNHACVFAFTLLYAYSQHSENATQHSYENQENENRSAQSARNITVTKYNIQWRLADCESKRKREKEGVRGRV